MTLDELGKEWRATNEVAATKERRDQLIAATCRRVERFWGRIFRRDMTETVVAVVVIALFGYLLITTSSTLEKIGASTIVGGAAYIIYRLQRARRETPPAPLEIPLRDYCNTELARVEKQMTLLRTILTWYIAPIMLGTVLMSFGRLGARGRFFVDLAIFAAMSWGIYALNQWTVRKHFVPVSDELLSLRRQLELDEDENGENSGQCGEGEASDDKKHRKCP